METYKTQELKDAAIVEQQKVVDNATAGNLEVEKEELVKIKDAQVVA